jgi:hypothetical protein
MAKRLPAIVGKVLPSRAAFIDPAAHGLERFMVEIRRRPVLRHGTDHDSKPLPSFPRFCLPARPIQCRQEEYRSGRATAQGFGRSLLALPFAGALGALALNLLEPKRSLLSGEITDEIHVRVAAGRARRFDPCLVPIQPWLVAPIEFP